ncbi:thiamine pyrophosphate-dependent enzyme [Dactylosporangium sp. NPDC000244]|uniref:thiamine pyrophosphate-dependent enzyme n=1 Tax=Dactylosporangium sp. NPDC000244 TaxID=3154365 RepID=UPI003317E76C
MLKRTGGQLLVDCLLAHDIPLITCVPGESFLPVMDALHDLPQAEGAPRLIVTRHEAAAANIAEAAGKLTGRPAVCLVTRGPGATHASIGVHTAFQDGTPLILVIGQVPRPHLGRNAFQEMDYSRVFGSSAKAVVTIMEADRIPEHVARAVHIAQSGRPGPVVLVTPEDVLAEVDVAVAAPLHAPAYDAPLISPADAERLCDALTRARRPMIIAGGAGWGTRVGDAITAFAEVNSIPIATAFRWQDCVDNSSESFVGYVGLGCDPALRARLFEADLLLAFGAGLDDPTSGGFELDRHPNVMVVSPAAADLCLNMIPTSAVIGSLESAAEVLATIEVAKQPERKEWLADLRAAYLAFRTPRSGHDAPVDLARIVSHLDSVLPDDAIITNGAGNYTVWVQRFYRFRQFRTQLAPRNGAMGYGIPAGLAAAALKPGTTVVTFDGDGCALMSGSEIATAVQYGLKVVIIVVNNSMLGTIRMHQERSYPGRPIGTQLTNPDFVQYAASFGIAAYRVAGTEDFAAAFAGALRQDGPALIEVQTDPAQLTPDLRLDLATTAGAGNRLTPGMQAE